MSSIPVPFEEFHNSIDFENSYSKDAVQRILLFGGQLSSESAEFCPSCRDAFFNALAFADHELLKNILLAEDIFSFYKEAEYPDLLAFELDLAELSTATVIIPESWGSVAELGSFSVLEVFRDQLLIVSREPNEFGSSYVYNGPIKYARNQKIDSVVEHSWEINADGGYKTASFADTDKLAEQVLALSKKNTKGKKLNPKWKGHVFYFVLGLLKVALLVKVTELHGFAMRMGLDFGGLKEFKKRIKLLKFLGYITEVKRKGQPYITLKHLDTDYVKFAYQKKANYRESMAWMGYFLDYYEKNDPNRFAAWQTHLKALTGGSHE